MEFEEKEYTNIYRMLDDMVLFVKENGGEYYPSVISDRDISFWNTKSLENKIEQRWSIKTELVPKDSEILKVLMSYDGREKFFKVINSQSKDFKKKITEEEIIKILQEECTINLI